MDVDENLKFTGEAIKQCSLLIATSHRSVVVDGINPDIWTLFSRNILADHIYQLVETFNGECADPRDKVFGLLGLVPPTERIDVNYNMSVADVFWAVVDVTYRRPGLDSNLDRRGWGLQALTTLSKNMGLSSEVQPHILFRYVQRIYEAGGWSWPPAGILIQGDAIREDESYDWGIYYKEKFGWG